MRSKCLNGYEAEQKEMKTMFQGQSTKSKLCKVKEMYYFVT